MIGTVFKHLLGFLVVVLAVFIGWCNLDPKLPWEARLFVCIYPIVKGHLPPAMFGHGTLPTNKATPPLPVDMVAQPRPQHELFATLLGSGDKMPLQGLGMCCRPTAYDHLSVERSVEWYILLGGRHIDGAHLYLNHEAIGRGIRNAMNRTNIPREELFITTKVYPTSFGYESTQEAVDLMLRELGLDYVDMVLMHAPKRFIPGSSSPRGCQNLSEKECRQETWKALSRLRQEHKIRNAGVSNFGIHHLKDILELYDDPSDDDIAPVTNNQIQWNPWVNKDWVETLEFCQNHEIQITGWNSLGGVFEGSKAAELEVIQKLAQKHHRSVQSILLRWALQSGVAVIPGTGNPEYMKENLAVYEFELSEFEMTVIDGLREEIGDQFMDMPMQD